TEPAHLLRYLSIAQQLDAVLVRTLITRPGIDEAGQEIRSILPAFEAAGVTLAIENHGLHPTAQLAGLLQGLGSAYAGCCLDTVNSFGALEGPEMVIQGLAPFIVNLHIKDFEITRVDHQMG
ncbi:sugar phosphate isomerase/epimerase, partial [Paenibacillus sepulcri]|nr:sugar phosphate isomerase/epimerase [Paenibacillus sepulcri]